MKKLLTMAVLVLICTACANKSTVNILISNENRKDTTNVIVKVSIEEILNHVDAPAVDSLILLNEKNQKVEFSIASDKKNIEFVVPVVKAYSQKNYSLNTNSNNLSDNLFTFRATSINISLK